MRYLKAFETNELGPKVGDYIYAIGIHDIGIYKVIEYIPASIWQYYCKPEELFSTNKYVEPQIWFRSQDVLVWGKTKEDVEKQLIQKRFDL